MPTELLLFLIPVPVLVVMVFEAVKSHASPRRDVGPRVPYVTPELTLAVMKAEYVLAQDNFQRIAREHDAEVDQSEGVAAVQDADLIAGLEEFAGMARRMGNPARAELIERALMRIIELERLAKKETTDV